MIQGDYADDEVATVEREATAARLSEEIPGGLFLNQSNNHSNPKGYSSLAEEILDELGDAMDIFVACVDTGGSITGTTRVLRNRIPGLYVVGVEPVGSTVFGFRGGPYKVGLEFPLATVLGLFMNPH